MTARKPANRNFSDWVDDQIKEAQDRGEFDNLPGAGKPLQGLDGQHDELWWVRQWLVREGVSYLPPPLALRLEAEKLLEGLDRLSSEDAVRRAFGELNERICHANRMPAIVGPPTTLMPLDVDALVERWRTSRSLLDEGSSTPTEESGADGTSRAGAERRVGARRWWRRLRPGQPSG